MQKGAGRSAWLSLCNRYEKEVTWLRAPGVKESREQIGLIYFGIKIAKQGGENLLSSLMGSMFGGGGASAPATGGAGRGRSIAAPSLD